MKEKRSNGPNILAGAILGASIALSSSVATARDEVKNDVVRCTPTQPQTAEQILDKRPKVVKNGEIFFPTTVWNEELYEDVDILVPYEVALEQTRKTLANQRKDTIQLTQQGSQTQLGAAAIVTSGETGCI